MLSFISCRNWWRLHTRDTPPLSRFSQLDTLCVHSPIIGSDSTRASYHCLESYFSAIIHRSYITAQTGQRCTFESTWYCVVSNDHISLCQLLLAKQASKHHKAKSSSALMILQRVASLLANILTPGAYMLAEWGIVWSPNSALKSAFISTFKSVFAQKSVQKSAI